MISPAKKFPCFEYQKFEVPGDSFTKVHLFLGTDSNRCVHELKLQSEKLAAAEEVVACLEKQIKQRLGVQLNGWY